MLNEILTPFLDSMQRHRASAPPSAREEEMRRAGRGAAMTAIAAYAAFLASFSLAPDLRQLAHDPRRVPDGIWMLVAAWAAFVCLGVLLFVVGCRRSRGERDALIAAKACAFAAIVVGLVWWGAFPADRPTLDLLLSALYLWVFVANLVKLILALRGMPAQRLPDPEYVDDLPMSGPATRDQAQDGMSGRHDWVPPRFRS
jgi:hypothetical protein